MDHVINADVVLYGILALIVLENTLGIYISWRQVKVYKTARTVPKELENVMDEETFHKARLYGLDQEQFGIFKAILMDVIVLSLVLFSGPMFCNLSDNLSK